MNERCRVIVVDDEEDLREPVVDYLCSEGLDASAASGAAELDAAIEAGPVHLVVLDVNMPGEDGFSIARRLRAAGPVGIIMLTAKRDLVDRVVGLEVGADDYLSKPFEPRELLARIRAVLRRAVSQPAPPADAEPAPAPAGAYDDAFWVPGPQGQVRVPVGAIEWIEAAKDYVLLHTSGGRSHMLRITMSALEKRLDPAALMRVHRSAFVRMEAVASVQPSGRVMTLVLRSGGAAPVGPQYAEEVRRRLAR
jgi:DNA-binding LytR/AlgR family response regulator